MTFKASNSEIFFATLSAERKQTDGKETSSGDDEPDENEELAEVYASLTDEQMLGKASVAIESEISVKHLLMYDVYNFAKWHLKTDFHFSRLRCSEKYAIVLKSHLT